MFQRIYFHQITKRYCNNILMINYLINILKIFIFQIRNFSIIRKLPIYDILKILRAPYPKKGTFASHIQKSL